MPRFLRRTLALGAVSAFIIGAYRQAADTTGGDIPPQDAALVSRGAERYQAGCAECHGSDLRGTDRGPSHLSAVYEPTRDGDAAFLLAVLKGSPAHPLAVR